MSGAGPFPKLQDLRAAHPEWLVQRHLTFEEGCTGAYVGTILAVACYLGSEPGGGVDPCGKDGRPPTDERQEGTKYALTHVVSLSAAYLVVMTAMRYFLQQQLSGSQSSLSLFALEARGGLLPAPLSELRSNRTVLLLRLIQTALAWLGTPEFQRKICNFKDNC